MIPVKMFYKEDGEMMVLSIDIGVIHLGLSLMSIQSDYSLKAVEWIDLIDITKYQHHSVSAKDCTLYHTRTMSDWLTHTIQENRIFFEEADVILLERQPPMSPFIAIEQLIFSKYRNKTYLISPKNVHTYLRISHLTYDERKIYSVKIASKYLPSRYIEQLAQYDRPHDIADSICIFLYWRDKKEKEYERQERIKQFAMIKDMDGLDVFEKLERFRYVRRK